MKPLLFRDLPVRNIPIPPVTGFNNNSRPVANYYDDSRTFRDRTFSNKRRRGEGQDELLDAVFDLTHDFPPVAPPDRPAVDVASIKEVLVEATAMAESLKPMLQRDDIPADSRAIVSMLVTLVGLVGAVVEKGVEPLSTAVVSGGSATGRGFANAARRLANPPPQRPHVVAGRKELVEALKRSETESVLFGADLGASGLAHRGSLNAGFTADLKRRTVTMAEGCPEASVEESLRVVEDALACVDNIEFLGQRSQPYKNPGETVPQNFCSLPIRLTFTDRDSRMNFEKTIREQTGLKASQSLPPVIRKQMAAFRRALEARYVGDMIMARPDLRSLEFVAYRREGGVGKWLQLSESFPIPSNILLSGYQLNETVTLPPVVVAVEDGAMGGEMAVG